MNDQMKAATYEKYGPPEVVKLTLVDKPVPKNNEVLVRVHATTVNRTDCGIRSAVYFVSRFFTGFLSPKYKILGNEYSGEIEGLGKHVQSFKVGDKVFGYNDTKFGAHAEYKTEAEDDAIATMPADFAYEETAPITEGGHYALCFLRAVKIQEGQNLLIYGATGAIGSAAVQLAKYFGVRVTAVCNTKNLELVKSLGADVVVDYTKEDFTKITQRFDVAFDAVGKSSFGKCKPLLKRNGIYISTELGRNAENIFLALITRFFGSKRVLFPIPTINKKDVVFLKELVETGKYKPVIDRKYTFDQIVEAYEYVETEQKTGNVIISLTE